MDTPDSRPPQVENKEGFGRRIIIADDELIVRRPIERFLISLGYTVEVVDNGQQLLDKLAAGEKYDLVITDNDMPVMKGVEAVRQIRELYPDLPVIIYSGGGKTDEIRELRVRFLAKPFELQELRGIIKRMISGGDGEI